MPLAGSVHQLDNARLEAPGPVRKEGELRDVAHTHPLLELVADVAFGGLQAGDGCLLYTSRCV